MEKTQLQKYQILRHIMALCLFDCEIITGRTHQIRVHLLSLGLPIIGDKDYIINKSKNFV